jgi:hypothetical protein
MSEDTTLVTQVDDAVSDGGAVVDDGTASGENESPFLAVNDRTSYKTREDALKGFNEAQSRITTLSGYEKVLKKYGAKDANPELLERIVTEYLTLKNDKGKTATTTPTATTSPEDDGLTAEDKAALKWLEKNAVKAGYVSKKDMEALQAKLEAIEGKSTKAQEAQYEANVAECQEAVTGWLGEAKVALTDEERDDLESHIAAWVNARDERVTKFNRGGQSAVALIREGYGKMLPIVKEGAVAFPSTAKTVVAAGKTKTGLINKTNRPMPKAGEPAAATQTNAVKLPTRVTDGSLFEKATALAAKIRSERAGAGE